MTISQKQFLTYVCTKMVFSLRLRSETDTPQPVHIKSAEIESRFFKYNRKRQIQNLIDSNELKVTQIGNAFYYEAIKHKEFNLGLLQAKPIPTDATTQTMLKHLKNVSLPDNAPSTDYFNLFLKHKAKRPDLFFTVDEFAKRVHTPVTNFHRTHRPNLLLYGKQTAGIDVTTMQPLLLGKILFNAIGENEYSDWINEGKDIYLMLKDKANLNTRDEAKKKFFEILFSKPNDALKTMFGRADWINWINEYKQISEPGNPHNKDKPHSNLAWKLQGNEVRIMRKVWDKLINANIPFLSVHDEIIIQIDLKEQAKKIMNEVLESEFDYFKLNTKQAPLQAQTPPATLIIPHDKETLTTLLNELYDKIPNDIPATIDNEDYPCFKAVVSMVLEGWVQSNSKYFQDRIREIFHIMHLNGFTQFENKY